MNAKSFSILFWINTLAHLLFEALLIAGNEQVLIPAMVTKALLMPLLIGYYYKVTAPGITSAQKLILWGFVFSFSGDVNLMMPRLESLKPYEELFFLAGLVSFLITHVLYMLSFRKDFANNAQPGILKAKIYLIIPVIAALAALLAILVPTIQANEPDMLVPVIIYASVITLMVIFAINRWGKVSAVGYWAVLAGALLFMFSDSNIAINKFHTPFAMAPLVIMSTYISSQFLFAWGTRKGV